MLGGVWLMGHLGHALSSVCLRAHHLGGASVAGVVGLLLLLAVGLLLLAVGCLLLLLW